MKNCIKCGAEISDSAKFCGKCGASQEKPTKRCIKCGAVIFADLLFCEQCGTRQTDNMQPEEQTTPQTPAPESELLGVRKRLLPYMVFTFIAQLAIIVFMFLDFGVIRVGETVEINGQTIASEGRYGVNLFDLLNYSDNLKEISPDIIEFLASFNREVNLQGRVDSLEGLSLLLLFPLSISILFLFIFTVSNIFRPTKYSTACLFFPVLFIFFSLEASASASGLITGLFDYRYYYDLYSQLNEQFSYTLSWEAIAIIVLAVAQLIANIAVRKIVIKTDKQRLIDKINLIINKKGWLIISIILVVIGVLILILSHSALAILFYSIAIVLPFIGVFAFVYFTGK